MNRTMRFAAAAVAAGFILAPVAQASEPNTGEQRAVEAAKKGPAELRRFIQRTRMIYGLSYEQFRTAS
ncbi:hypothetical protein DSM104443_00121 [Usitatibacter rugosus]|uniref:Uncharacterized protein n=1 Tax=Usitatibacter rugosus TaxID=2732067 RepID=A0A6M4GPT4_9PROT|nr:hypothetical protein [Usitatibacter rugosus]QJR09085.1 hypothetical protein DSM104443_00121 [Usitatibacter rugosus]